MKRLLFLFPFLFFFISFKSYATDIDYQIGYVMEGEITMTFSTSSPANYSAYTYSGKQLSFHADGSFFVVNNTVRSFYHVVGFNQINSQPQYYDFWVLEAPSSNVLKTYTVVTPYFYSVTDNSIVSMVEVTNFPDFPDYLEYPPAFPVSDGLSYSTPFSDSLYIDNLTISSSGLTIPDGYLYGIVNVTFAFHLSSILVLKPGNFMIPYKFSGNTPYDLPSFMSSNSTYVTSVHASSQMSPTSFSFPIGRNPAFTVSFFYGGSERWVTDLSFTVSFFVMEDVSSFRLSFPIEQNASSFDRIMIADNNLILSNFDNLNNSFTSAGGANSGLNSQNSAMDKALSDYQKDTDTSTQYGNISDSLFTLDTSIFVQVSSTISLFSSVVTGLFNAFGDLSVPLTMFLIVTVISCIIGIIKVTSDSS